MYQIQRFLLHGGIVAIGIVVFGSGVQLVHAQDGSGSVPANIIAAHEGYMREQAPYGSALARVLQSAMPQNAAAYMEQLSLLLQKRAQVMRVWVGLRDVHAPQSAEQSALGAQSDMLFQAAVALRAEGTQAQFAQRLERLPTQMEEYDQAAVAMSLAVWQARAAKIATELEALKVAMGSASHFMAELDALRAQVVRVQTHIDQASAALVGVDDPTDAGFEELSIYVAALSGSDGLWTQVGGFVQRVRAEL